MVSRLPKSAMAFSIIFALASCGKVDVKRDLAQLAARVNGDEISVLQLNDAIASSGKDSRDEPKQPAAQFPDRTLEQELLARKAVESRLDREPQVAQAIDAAKRQILAEAYLEKLVSAVPKERPEEVRQFYKQNSALFERRRIYRFQELVVTAPQEKFAALETETATAHNLNDIANWLNLQKLPFEVATATKPAEQIPMEVLSRVSGMRDGQMAVFPMPRGASVVQLVRSRRAPLDETQAAPVIEQFLANRKRIEIVGAEVKKLREAASIDYLRSAGTIDWQASAWPRFSSARAGRHQEKENGKVERILFSPSR